MVEKGGEEMVSEEAIPHHLQQTGQAESPLAVTLVWGGCFLLLFSLYPILAEPKMERLRAKGKGRTRVVLSVV